MQNLIDDSFLGYMPGIANAPANSALSMKNCLLHHHRDFSKGGMPGWIEQAEGYAKKNFVTGCATPGVIPGNDATIRKISNFAAENIFNLWIPDNAGANVTVLTASYRKTGFFPGNPTIDRFGIWIRPYWNGAAWIDAWYELTEMFIFTLEILGAFPHADRLYIDNSLWNFGDMDPTGIVFNTDYFKDWTIVYAAYGDDQNYDLIRSSDFDGGNYWLQLTHANNDYAWGVGTKLLVYRSFQTAELPSTLVSQIRGLLSEIRMTSGNLVTDTSLMAGYRNISFPFVGDIPGHSYTKSYNRILADTAMPKVWQYAVVLGICDKSAAPDPLDPGTYYLRYSLVFDDGNESCHFGAFTEIAGGGLDWTILAVGDSITLVAGHGIKINALRSFGALPPRAQYLRVYMSDDNNLFYRTLDIDLRLAATWTQPALDVATLVETLGAIKHAWAPSIDIDLTKTIWPSPGEIEASVQLGRAITDDGVVQYTNAVTVGRTCYYLNVRKNGTLYPNTVFATTATGDGRPARDSVGLVTTLMIDLEYNDGDQLVGGEALQDRLWVGKRSTTVVVTKDRTGAFNAQIVTQDDGLASIRSLAKFQDVLYWEGYGGIYEYSTRGNVKLNEASFEEEWLNVPQADKEAAVGTIDRTNLEYHLAYGALERIYNIRTKQWRCATRANVPSRFAANLRTGTVDFLSGPYIQTLAPLIKQDGANFDVEFETNERELAPNIGEMANLVALEIRYNAAVAISVQIYADQVAAGSAQSLAASATDVDAVLHAPLSTVCKRYRVKFTATITANGQTLQIKHLKPLYELIPAGISAVV